MLDLNDCLQTKSEITKTEQFKKREYLLPKINGGTILRHNHTSWNTKLVS